MSSFNVLLELCLGENSVELRLYWKVGLDKLLDQVSVGPWIAVAMEGDLRLGDRFPKHLAIAMIIYQQHWNVGEGLALFEHRGDLNPVGALVSCAPLLDINHEKSQGGAFLSYVLKIFRVGGDRHLQPLIFKPPCLLLPTGSIVGEDAKHCSLATDFILCGFPIS